MVVWLQWLLVRSFSGSISGEFTGNMKTASLKKNSAQGSEEF